MIKVKNNQTGKTQTLPDDSNLPDMVSSGEVSIPKQDYEFLSPEGDKYAVPASGFLDAVKQGWKHQSQKIKEDQRLEAKYGDSPGKALALSTASGLTLGLSNVLLEKSGAMTEEDLKETRDRNQTSSMIGEVTGSVVPAFFTGGTSLAAKGMALTGPGLIAKLAAKQGARAALNTTNVVAKRAIALGVEGAIDGAGAGLTQFITEAELGDAEFNAETFLAKVGTGALLGAGAGATFGAGIEYAKKAVKGGVKQFEKVLINSSDMSEAEKKTAHALNDSKRETSEILKTVFEDAEFKAVAAKNNWPTTPGMETKSKLFQNFESSIAEGASGPAMTVQKNIDTVYETIDGEIEKVIGGADEISPYAAGQDIKRVITSDIDSRLAPHRDFLQQLDQNMGNAPFNEIIQKRAISRLSRSPSYRLAGHSRAKYAIDLIENSKNLNDLEFARKEVGKILGSIRKTGQDVELESFMGDAYATIKRAKKDAVIKNALELGPKRGLKMAKLIVKEMDKSDEAYKAIYKEYAPVAERLGIKLNGAEFFLDSMAEEASEKIGQKIIDIDDFDFMQSLYKKQPQIYDMARKVQLTKIAKAVTDSSTGEISPVRFAKKVRDMTKEQRQILFGFDGKANARIDDLLKYIEKAPKKLGTSGTATVQFFQKILSPVYQASEYARYALYKGGESAIKTHLTTKLPIYSAIESSSNYQKNKIASSISGFFKATSVGIAAGTLSGLSEKDLEKARKSYELVQTSPNVLVDKFVSNNKELIEAAPQTANALQQRIIAGVQFLQSKTPHKDQEYIGEKMEPSRSELIKFNDYVEAVEKPQIVYDQLKQGYLNSNTLEALRTVYPKIYGSIQAEVLAKLPKTLTRAQKIQLQPLLGSKVTPSMDYQNLMILQGKTQGSAQANQQASQEVDHVPVGAVKNMKVANRAKSGLDKTLYRS